MAGIQKAEWEFRKTVPMAEDAGVALAEKWFGISREQIEKTCGYFVRGKNAHKLRGWIVYAKCRVGGWQFVAGGGSAGVIRPGMIFAQFYNTYEEMAASRQDSAGQFVIQGKRVDSAYGYDWRAEDAKRAAAVAQESLDAAEREKSRKLGAAGFVCIQIEETLDRVLIGRERRLIDKVVLSETLTPEDEAEWKALAEELAATNARKGLPNTPVLPGDTTNAI